LTVGSLKIAPQNLAGRGGSPARRRGPEASAEDIALTRRLAAASRLLGIELLDHLIPGEAGRFVSLRERGVA
jgi:hypothetical protein